jgi:hypothetical protein
MQIRRRRGSKPAALLTSVVCFIEDEHVPQKFAFYGLVFARNRAVC